MRNASRWAASLGLLLSVAAVLPAQDFGIAVGSKAPGARVETLDGREVDLAEYLGKESRNISILPSRSCSASDPSSLGSTEPRPLHGRKDSFWSSKDTSTNCL